MRHALRLAERGGAAGEVPIAAVVVIDGRIIGSACNRRESRRDATAHAEVLAIRKACGKLGDWRLEGATLYVTMEPCLMCYGSVVQSRIGTVVYACENQKNPGYLRKVYAEWPRGPKIVGGVEREAAVALLGKFFKRLRNS